MSLRCKALTSCSLGINFPYCVRVFHLLQLYVLVSHHTDTPLYVCNTHQEEQRPTITDGTDRLQLSIDTRQTLGKRPTYEDRNQAGTHPSTSPSKKNRPPQPLGSEYTSLMLHLIPQVNYTEGPSITKPSDHLELSSQSPPKEISHHLHPHIRPNEISHHITPTHSS